MALKDTWKDLENVVEGVPDSGEMASADDINEIAHAVIDIEKNGVSTDTIKPLINEALTEAKESGEFDGEDGKPYAYILTTDDDGNLYCEYADTDTPPNFVYDEETGYVYYVTENSTRYEVLDVNIIVEKVLGQFPEGGATTFSLMSIDNEIGTKDLVITDATGQTVLNMSFVRDDTDTATIMTVSNIDGQSVDITIRDGKDGVDGQNGADGKDGKDGQDYVLTPTDKNEIAELVKTLIPLDQYAKTSDIPTDYIKTVNGVAPNEEGNVTISATINPPDVVDSVEEMTDTSKQYVLSSTGTIWAYKTIETETETEKTEIYDNGNGFTSGYRIKSGGLLESGQNGYSITPIINIKDYPLPLTISLSGLPWVVSGNIGSRRIILSSLNPFNLDGSLNEEYQTNVANLLYNANVDDATNLSPKYVTSRDNTLGTCTLTFTNENLTERYKDAENIYYFQSTINENNPKNAKMVLTYTIKNSETETKWVDTGVPFSGKDYSEEIATLQADVDALKSSSGGNVIPSYVIEEAERVADNILSVRTAESLVFLTGSDIHVNIDDSVSKTAIEHMGQGMNQIRRYTTPDCIVLLGDYVDNASETVTEAKSEIKYARNTVSEAMKGCPMLWLNGNHDCSSGIEGNRLTNNEIFSYVGSNNSNAPTIVVDDTNIVKNYGYIDFSKQKIRLIYLNTSDMVDSSTLTSYFTKTQGDWLVSKALDLSSKGDDELNWGVIVCSHHPFTSRADIKDILFGFADKTSGNTSTSNGSVSFDFTNVKAEFISHFHGHLHNFRADTYISSGGKSVVSITVPNACPTPSNYYGKDITQEGNNIVGEQGSYDDGDKLREVDPNTGKSVYYYKTAGTAEDTSFCAITVDRENGKIYAHCYGAGYDREVTYKEV